MDSKAIGYRISNALALRHKKQKELAAVIHVPDNTISYFCSGRRIPNIKQLIQIAVFLETTPDYILGFTDAPSVETDVRSVQEYTGMTFEAVENIRSHLVFARFTREQQDIANWFLASGLFDSLIVAMERYKAMTEACLIEKQTQDDSEPSVIVDDGTRSITEIERRAAKIDMVETVLRIAKKFDSDAISETKGARTDGEH